MPDTQTPPPARGRFAGRLARVGVLVVAGAFLLVFLLGVGVRYGAETGPGRALIERLIEGTKIGPVGKLHIEGLQGDVFRTFGVRKLQVIDAKGVWIEADDLAMSWDPGELFARRFHAGRIGARLVRIYRQPLAEKQPAQPPSKPPVSVIIDKLALRLETAPEFSMQRGLWDVDGKVILRRSGAAKGALTAKSLLHPGDGLDLAFQLGKKDRMLLRADAVESNGGALAGTLGLPADRRLLIHARGDGTMAAGQLVATATSGADTPLNLTAKWDKAGLTADGRVSLAASKLTRYFADRLGPDATVHAFASPIKGDLYKLDATLIARDGKVALDGPVDAKARKAAALGVQLSVSDLSKWLGVPKIGPAQVHGALTGDFSNFTLKGDFAGQKLEQDGIAVADLRGPASVTYANGEWRILGDLQGSGAGGAAPLGPLVGPRPHATLDISLLKDGRLLIRSLNLVGSGLKVAATGGQGLFGGLSFKGTAQVSNLAPIHAGAHGGVNASWDAAEAKGGKSWSLSFDAKGAAFVTGIAELDHFLGAQPRLTAKGSIGAGKLVVDRADLTGQALQADAKGVLGDKEALAFDINWSAKGPFEAGPVEIAGQAKGAGKLSGTLSAPRADLTAELASIDFGRLVVTPARLTLSLLQASQGVEGLVSVEGPTPQNGHASLKSAFRFAGDGVDLTDLVADAGGVKLLGAVSLKNGAPSTADLSVAAGPGAFLTAGKLTGTAKLTDRPGGAVADLKLDGEGISSPDLPVSLRALHLTASGPLSHLPFQASVDSVDPVAWSFKGDGVYAATKADTAVTLNGAGKFRKAVYKTSEPAAIHFGPQGQSAKIDVSFAGGRATLDARQSGDAFNARLDLAGVGLGAIQEDFTGKISGAATLNGKGAHLTGALDATLDGARSRDEPISEALAAHIKGELSDTRLHLTAKGTNSQGLTADIDLSLPTVASAAPFRIAIDRTKPIGGSMSAEGEVRPLWDLFASGERTLSGKLSAHAAFGGTLADPKATGSASLSGGKFKDVTTGLALQDLGVAVGFGQDEITVSNFSGADGRGGSLNGNGKVSLARNGGSTFTLNAKKFQLIDNEIGRATASGAVTVTRDAEGKARLAGALVIDRADFAANTPTPTGVVPLEVVEIHQAPKEGIEKPQPKGVGPQVTLDVSLKAARGIFLKGKGLDAEFSLDSHVGGTILAPDLSGTARIVRGSYDFAGQRFEFDERGTVRLGSSAQDIRLDLTATREDPTLTAVVRVKGTAAKPEITLSSTPVLPQDEVLSRVLFGVSAAQLSPAQGAQLASALASLAGGGGFDIIGNLRQFAGLDRLALGGTQTTGTTVSGGKYLTDNVYLELTGGGRTGPSAQVEWRVRRDLSFISMVGTQGDARLSVRFRKDY